MYLICSPSLSLATSDFFFFLHEFWLLNSSGRTCKAGAFTHWATLLDSSMRSTWGGANAVTWPEVLLRHQAYDSRTRESLIFFFFGHKLVGFDYKNSACTDGNAGERRIEFIVSAVFELLPACLCCFFISTTGGRLLVDLLCDSVGQISCYWQLKVNSSIFF